MMYNNDRGTMNDKKQSPSIKPKDTYLVHLDSGTVSVEATSLNEAIKLAEQLAKENKETSNG